MSLALKQAVRSLWSTRLFAATTVLIFGVSIGLAAALSVVVELTLLRPLPFPTASRLVRLSQDTSDAAMPLAERVLSAPTFAAWQSHATALDGLAAFESRSYTLMSNGEAIRIVGASVSPQLFSVLGVSAVAGNFFDVAGVAADPRVVVISERLWRQHFRGDVAAIGMSIMLAGRPTRIVGIAPASLTFPSAATEAWTPFVLPEGDRARTAVVTAIGLLSATASIEQAQAEGRAIAAGAAPLPAQSKAFLGTQGSPAVHVQPLLADVTRAVRPPLILLSLAVALLLAVACANLASLLLAAHFSRQAAHMIQAALGANMRQVWARTAWEATILIATSTVAALIVAWWLITLFSTAAPPDFPRLEGIYPRVGLIVSYSLAIAGVSWLVTMLPLVAASRSSANMPRGIGTTMTVTRPQRSARGWLVSTQTALTTFIVVIGSLLSTAYVALLRIDPGYEVANTISATAYVAGSAANPQRAVQFLQSLEQSLAGSDGVVAVGGGNMAPFGESVFASTFELPTALGSHQFTTVQSAEYSVSPSYPAALGLRLKEGRFFTAQDLTRTPVPALINEEFARRYFGSDRMVGRIIPSGLGSNKSPTEIIGIVGNVLRDGLETQPQPELYLLYAHGLPLRRELNILVRTRSAAAAPAMVARVRDAAKQADKTAAIDRVTPLSTLVSRSISQQRLGAMMLGVTSLISLIVCAAGTYSLVSYVVLRERREVGIRMALGAQHRTVVRHMLSFGLVWVAAGVSIGLVMSWTFSRWLKDSVFGQLEPTVQIFGFTAVGILLIGVTACLGPALQALRTDITQLNRTT